MKENKNGKSTERERTDKNKNLFWSDPRIRIDDTFELTADVVASPTYRGVDWVDG